MEAIVADELTGLGVTPQPLPGGVRFTAPLATGMRIALTARTPSRLLLEVIRGKVFTSEELGGLVRRGDWKPYLHPLAKVEVEVTTQRSRLHFRDTLAHKVEQCLKEAIKGPRVMDRERRPELLQRVSARITEDEAILSIDAGGELLHRRGWRTEGGPATLRENLAAGMLQLAGWTGDDALVDPFCGTGTIPIEAALLAAQRSPFVGRTLACAEWPEKSGAWKTAAKLPPPQRVLAPIVGADRDPRAIGAALRCAERARVQVAWKHCDILSLEPPAPVGWIVTNPPYGHRLEEDHAYRALGRVLKERFLGWNAVFLAPHAQLARHVHPQAECLTTFSNGGLRVGVYGVSAQRIHSAG